MTDRIKLLSERSKEGHRATDFPYADVPELQHLIPAPFAAKGEMELPEVSEIELARHYTALLCGNVGAGKYAPKVMEKGAALFSNLHPLSDEPMTEGAWKLMWYLQSAICEIAGMDAFTLQPNSRAQAERCVGMLLRAYYEKSGQTKRDQILVPQSMQNLDALAATTGFRIVPVKSDPLCGIDTEALKAAVGEQTAALMLTTPNALGLFEKNITKISEIVHGAGGLLCFDAENLNGIMGVTRPGDLGFDLVILDFERNFSVPHAHGEKGACPVGVKKALQDFLPTPRIVYEEETDAVRCEYDCPDSIGRLSDTYGSFADMTKAFGYILSLGAPGLRRACENAVLNANYVKEHLKDTFDMPYDGSCAQTCALLSVKDDKEVPIATVAAELKALGYFAPVCTLPDGREALLLEPNETASREDLDALIAALKKIVNTAKDAK